MLVFFLAGPVEGSPRWHPQFCRELQKQMNVVMPGVEFCVAIPSNRYSNDRSRHRIDPDVKDNQITPTMYFGDQNTWERYHLELASKQGCIIFWLPVEDREHPREDGSYAQCTRGELGEWRGRYVYDKSIKIVVGGERRFPGLSTIHENFLAVDHNFPFYETIEETVEAAIKQTMRC